jgi:putative sterol carrier protein
MEENYDFPSLNWMENYCEKLSGSSEYNSAAINWEGDFVFVVKEENSRLFYYMDLWHGKCKRAVQLADENEAKAEFILTADYDTWKKLCQGESDITKALVYGKIKVKGSLPKLLKNMKGGKVMISVMRDVPTKFPR